MSDYIKDNRQTIIAMAVEGLLAVGIYGKSTHAQLVQLADALDDKHIDIEEANTYEAGELNKAFAAELVSTMDEKLIESFLRKPSERHVMDLKLIKPEVEPSFVGDKLALVGEKIKDVVASFEEGNTFILSSPLMLSVIQSLPCRTDFEAIEEGWHGPNWSHHVGEFVDTPIYSILYSTELNVEFSDDVIIIGNYHNGKTETQLITIYNLTFA